MSRFASFVAGLLIGLGLLAIGLVSGRSASSLVPDEIRSAVNNTVPGASERRTTAEWVSMSISAAIVLTMIVFTVYTELFTASGPATFSVTPLFDEVRQVDQSFHLPIEIRNTGGETVEDLQVRVALAAADGQDESVTLQVHFLAGGARERGTAVFRQQPTEASVVTDVLGYLEP